MARSPGRPAPGAAGASGLPLWALARVCCWLAAGEAGVGRAAHTPLRHGAGVLRGVRSVIGPRARRPAMPPQSLVSPGGLFQQSPAQCYPCGLPAILTAARTVGGAPSPLTSLHLHPQLPRAGLRLAAFSTSRPEVPVRSVGCHELTTIPPQWLSLPPQLAARRATHGLLAPGTPLPGGTLCSPYKGDVAPCAAVGGQGAGGLDGASGENQCLLPKEEFLSRACGWQDPSTWPLTGERTI